MDDHDVHQYRDYEEYYAYFIERARNGDTGTGRMLLGWAADALTKDPHHRFPVVFAEYLAETFTAALEADTDMVAYAMHITRPAHAPKKPPPAEFLGLYSFISGGRVLAGIDRSGHARCLEQIAEWMNNAGRGVETRTLQRWWKECSKGVELFGLPPPIEPEDIDLL
jgi:hypothetical protein